LLNGEEAHCDDQLLSDLARGWMILSDGFDELAYLRAKYERSRDSFTNFGMTIVTSLGCNFDCPYCFEAKHPSIMDDDVQAAVLEVLDNQLETITSFGVTWYGGEPLVGKQPLLRLADEFISRCDKRGVKYRSNIVTNGSLLTRVTCGELRDRRVSRAQVTLDGPPEIHDRMRPYVGGRGSFWRIVGNLHHAVDYLDVHIRVNIDARNQCYTEELLSILAAEGFAGRLSVGPGQIVGMESNPLAPSAQYGRSHCCLTKPEYAQVERDFLACARGYGLAAIGLPKPLSTPCTAVRRNEMVVGSKGELYKCWDSVGDKMEVIGDIRHYADTNGRLRKWLNYDPFSDPECKSCIALPVCMGGCAHHSMEISNRDNRCGTFRYTYQEQVDAFVADKA